MLSVFSDSFYSFLHFSSFFLVIWNSIANHTYGILRHDLSNVHGQWREISALFDQLFSILIGKIIKSHSFHFSFFRQRRKQKLIFHFISFDSFELGLQQKQYEYGIVKRKHEWREWLSCGLKKNTKTFLFFYGTLDTIPYYVGSQWT